ncbi:MAG TPA: ubiquitin-like protein Pup [Acidimicrobiia bacterium]|nr:ubiquitin-like protein Pup [Acidimicrobiia bacterium]
MTDQERSRSRSREKSDEDVEELEITEEESEADLEGLDDLLDEIDSVLEENAEEFVKNYVQKGGQ